MAMNQLYPEARHIAVVAPNAIESGDPVIIGGLAGVAQTTAGKGETVTIWLDGSYELPVSGTPKTGDVVSLKGKTLAVGTGTAFGVVITADQAAGTAEIVPLGAHNPAAVASS